ncbi:50S ribosomal protein L32 [Candidatus Bipolaricaulota bacterium]|nr:50S ribosomal protein L32 [Candidatus Bipolaricaulota bacterium]MCK4411687.1 50S ribosomal protein L32 [Candidatus Bipolaricaulota bacterium]
MPVPKYRTSRSKARMRRSHQAMSALTVSECPHCHEPKLPHRVCPHCGHYNGVEVITVSKKGK